MRPRLLLVLAAGLLVAADKPEKSKDAKKGLEAFQGQWTVVRVVEKGRDAPDNVIRDVKVTIKGDTLTIKAGMGSHDAALKNVDPGKKPKQIDLVPSDGVSKGKTCPGIYTFEGKELRMCFAEPGQKRPSDFTAEADTKRFLMVLKKK